MAETLREQQFSFARHLRDPLHQAPPPGIETRRMKVYRELFYNAVEGILAGGFPVLRSTLGDERWHGLVRAFYAGHRSQTPMFGEIGETFVGWLQAQPEDPSAPWAVELAHYEWVESHLYLSDAQDPPARVQGDLLEGVPVLSALAMPLAYRWPVNRIGAGYQPVQAPEVPTLLLVYRDAGHQVRFSQLTVLAYRLLVGLQVGCSGREQLLALAEEVGAEREMMVREGLGLLESMRGLGVVYLAG